MSNQIAFCAYVNASELGGQAPDTPAVLPAFASLVGRKPAGVMWYEARSLQQPFPAAKCDAVRGFGATPIVTWSQDLMANVGVAGGSDDAYYAGWARAAAAWKDPIYFRFDWEMNVQLGGTPADFVRMWRHLRAVFAGAGAANVRWVWCPNTKYYGTAPFAALYPGDDAVDWIGLDGYNWGHSDQWHWWSSFTQVFQASYQDLVAIAPTKPMLIGEVGCADDGTGDKGAWIRSALTVEIPRYFPAVRAVTWFHMNKEKDWRMNSSVPALAGTLAALASTYTGPPVPPPAIPLYGGGLP